MRCAHESLKLDATLDVVSCQAPHCHRQWPGSRRFDEEVARMVNRRLKDLGEYAHHRTVCAFRTFPAGARPCDCGLDVAKGLRKEAVPMIGSRNGPIGALGALALFVAMFCLLLLVFAPIAIDTSPPEVAIASIDPFALQPHVDQGFAAEFEGAMPENAESGLSVHVTKEYRALIAATPDRRFHAFRVASRCLSVPGLDRAKFYRVDGKATERPPLRC